MEHPIKQRLYGNISALSTTIKQFRMRFAGHFHRSKEELVSNFLLWAPRHGRASVGRPTKTYIHQLADDAKCGACNLEGLMRATDL